MTVPRPYALPPRMWRCQVHDVEWSQHQMPPVCWVDGCTAVPLPA